MLLNFLYGDICEELMLWLAEQSGHVVSHQQESLNAYGLRGYMDCSIDGHTVDAKSAFAKNFSKFKDGSIRAKGSDPYGYIGQLALPPINHIEQPNIKQRVEHLNTTIAKDAPPPEKCYPAEPDGKKGNLKLGTQCKRCRHKFECWPGLKVYNFKPWRYLTHVEEEPKKNQDITQYEKDK